MVLGLTVDQWIAIGGIIVKVLAAVVTIIA